MLLMRIMKIISPKL